jgi:hypothetical protein
MNAKWELNRFGGEILLSGVFFDLTQFNFHGLLFSQKKEDHPHHQDQNHSRITAKVNTIMYPKRFIIHLSPEPCGLSSPQRTQRKKY